MINLIKKHLPLLAIFFLAALLRIWHLGELPAVLHRDELAIGYNAASLLAVGQDEHGQTWPIVFESFGDYKLPGLIYTTIPVVKLLGLTPLAVRLPTAIFGTLSVILVFFLMKEMGWSKQLSYIVAMLMTLSFWQITQSRNVYEPIVGLFWSLLTWWSWLKGTKRWSWRVLAIISYGFSAVFYNVPWMMLPALLVMTELITNRNNFKKSMLSLSLIALIAVGHGWFLKDINASRSNTTVFSHQEIHDLSQLQVHAGLVAGLPSIVSRTVYHPIVLNIFAIVKNYLSAFDFTYLFFIGDHNAWHNLRDIGLGNLNPVLIIPYLWGILYLIKHAKQKKAQFVLIYWLISPLASALTIDAPITNRLLDFHTAVIMIAAIGTIDLWRKAKTVTLGLLVTYMGFWLLFSLRYFFSYNQLLSYSWNPQVEEMIDRVGQIKDEYDLIYVDDELPLAYIYFAFYQPIKPQEMIDQAVWSEDGFHQVNQFKTYRFYSYPRLESLIAKNLDDYLQEDTEKILIIERGQSPEKQTQVFEIKNWRNQVLWSSWSLTRDEILELL